MNKKPRQTCGGILLRNGKILLGKRNINRLYPDIWDIFGGHIEQNETKEHTLQRELEEELGIVATSIEFLESYQDKEPTFGYDYLHHIFIVHSWKGEPVNKNTREHEGIGWFSKEEIENLKMHGEVQRIVLEKVDF
jgi:mutator protein MutT